MDLPSEASLSLTEGFYQRLLVSSFRQVLGPRFQHTLPLLQSFAVVAPHRDPYPRRSTRLVYDPWYHTNVRSLIRAAICGVLLRRSVVHVAEPAKSVLIR